MKKVITVIYFEECPKSRIPKYSFKELSKEEYKILENELKKKNII